MNKPNKNSNIMKWMDYLKDNPNDFITGKDCLYIINALMKEINNKSEAKSPSYGKMALDVANGLYK